MIPALAVAGTSFVMGILGWRVVALPHIPFEVGLAASLTVAILCGLYRPTITMTVTAGLAAVAGVAAAWLFVLLVDPRDPGENIGFAWFAIGVMTAGAAGLGRLVASLRVQDQKSPGHR